MIDERKDKLGEQSEEQVNIQELLFRYLIHWPWFVISIIICIACAWGYLRLTTPIYNISATVLIKDEKKGGGASMSSDLEKMGLEGFVSSSSNVDNEIEVLRSKSLAREVVNNLEGIVICEKSNRTLICRKYSRQFIKLFPVLFFAYCNLYPQRTRWLKNHIYFHSTRKFIRFLMSQTH